MNKELKSEAENEFPMEGEDLFYGDFGKVQQSAFIAGATSKYVEKQKLEFAIEQLKRFRESTFGKGVDVIKELEQKLQEL